MSDTLMLSVDPVALRAGVRDKYRDVATHPHGDFHFHTGRLLAALLGYDRYLVRQLPDRAVESFAGVGNPHVIRPLRAGERVLDLGSGGGFDCFVAADAVGPLGAVIGVDMTPEMVAKARATAERLALDHVEFREGVIEELPVEDGWADVVIANGVLNLVADKTVAFEQAYRALRPGGVIQFTDIANGRPLPDETTCSIASWTCAMGGARPIGEWCRLLSDAGFTDVSVGPPIDTYGGSVGEANARRFDVHAHFFLAFKPG